MLHNLCTLQTLVLKITYWAASLLWTPWKNTVDTIGLFNTQVFALLNTWVARQITG